MTIFCWLIFKVVTQFEIIQYWASSNTNLLYSFSLSCIENASYKAPMFLRKLSVLFVVIIIYKKADIALVIYVTLLYSTVKQKECRKLASKHGTLVKSLFPFPANFLKFVVKISYADTFWTSCSKYNVFAFRTDFCQKLKCSVLFRQHFFKTPTR